MSDPARVPRYSVEKAVPHDWNWPALPDGAEVVNAAAYDAIAAQLAEARKQLADEDDARFSANLLRPLPARVPRIIFKGHVGEFVDASNYDAIAAQLARVEERNALLTQEVQKNGPLALDLMATRAERDALALKAEMLDACREDLATMKAERDALAAQLTEARWDAERVRSQLVQARAERDALAEQLQQMTKDRDYWKRCAGQIRRQEQ